MKYCMLYATALAAALPMAANAAVSVFVNIAPPALPVYVQPPIPAPNYLWTPGYWRWDPNGAEYFWVPGTWVAPPAVGLLWTPGYWGWAGGGYAWHAGYWGPHVGFYGGVNYGFGYVGSGYLGGRWDGGVFNYNRSVNNVNTTIVHNVYNERVVENNTHVSFNGGQGGIAAHETPQERQWHGEQHIAPTATQRQHEEVAMHTPEQHASFNHGAPTMAAMARPASAHGEAVAPHMQVAQHTQQGDPGHPQAQTMHEPHGGGEMHGPAERPHAEAPRGEPHAQAQPHGEAHGGGGKEHEHEH
jgi:hypothetical protein